MVNVGQSQKYSNDPETLRQLWLRLLQRVAHKVAADLHTETQKTNFSKANKPLSKRSPG